MPLRALAAVVACALVVGACSDDDAEEADTTEPTTTTEPGEERPGLDACHALTPQEVARVLGEDPGEGELDQPVEPIDPDSPPGLQFSECSWPGDDADLVLGLLAPTVGEGPLDHLESLQESDSGFAEGSEIITAGREGVEIAALVGADGNVIEATAVVNQVLIYIQAFVPIPANSPQFQAMAGLLVLVATRLDPPDIPTTTVPAEEGGEEAPATTGPPETTAPPTTAAP